MQDFEGREAPFPNKGVGPSGPTRNSWENISSSQQQRSAGVNLTVFVFSIAPKMAQVWEEKAQELEVR